MHPDMKRKRLLLSSTIAVVVVTLTVLYLIHSALLVIGISALIAYVLFPLARLLERGMPWRQRHPGLSRGVAIGLIFLGGLSIFVGALIMVIPPTVEQTARFIESFPDFLNDARITLERGVADYEHYVPEEQRAQVEELLAQAGVIIGKAAWNIVVQTLGVISGSFSFVIALATAPVLIFYLMKDAGPIRTSLYTPFPSALHPYLKDILDIVNRTLGGYIRGQLILGLIVGIIVTVGLLLLGIPFAFILGVVAGLTELIPIIGPWIGGAAAVLVTLATEPDKVIYVLLLYLIVQLLENALLVPRIQADTLNLHPIAIILIITVGSSYFGLWGIILGPPLVAVGKDLIVYIVQEWNSPAVAEAAALPEEAGDEAELNVAAEPDAAAGAGPEQIPSSP